LPKLLQKYEEVKNKVFFSKPNKLFVTLFNTKALKITFITSLLIQNRFVQKSFEQDIVGCGRGDAQN
jgi:hypothetical protein